MNKVEEEEMELNDEDMTKSEEAWGICVITYVLGKFLGIKSIEGVTKAWGVNS